MLTNTFQLEKWLNSGFSFILVPDFINISYEIKLHRVSECLETLQEKGVGSRGTKADWQTLLIRAG